MKVSGKIRSFIFVFAAGVLLGAAHPANGAIRQAASVSVTDVISAIASASDGDTVVVPAGTATWTSKLTITKAVTLQGSGIGRTIIRDGVQTGQFLSFSLVAGKASRLTGIEFQDGGRITFASPPGGVIKITGLNTNGSSFRMDHCKLVQLNGVYSTETVIGVLDHNDIISSTAFFYIYGTHWDGDTGRRGDKSWAAPTNFGSSQFLFFEDNTFMGGSSFMRAMTDSFNGGRFVIRHNTITNATIENHGADTGQHQGGRAIEVYNNNFVGTNINNKVGYARSAIILFHDNIISGYRTDATFSLHCFRMFHSFNIWGGADGTNPWDVNAPGGPFFTGTASGPSSGLTVTVSGNPNWRANQWVGYSVKRTTNLGGAGGDNFSVIASNTANTLTYSDAGGFTSDLSFANGDTLQIYKVVQALNQPGRARGSLITGNPPSRHGWNNQVTEPCYSWNNTRESGANVNFTARESVIRQNEHFFNDTAMPGYTPYTYPHPLTSSSPTSGATPSATRVPHTSSPHDHHKRKKKHKKGKKTGPTKY
jgi:hypothetical protein